MRLIASLRSQIISLVLVITLVTSAIFGFVGFIFAYSIEDRLFESALLEEAHVQQKHWTRYAQLAPAQREYIAVYRQIAEMPDDLRSLVDPTIEMEEYAGEFGRHYHVIRFELPNDGGIAYAVGEVSRYLQVRPRQSGMLKFQATLTISVIALVAAISWFFAARSTAPLVRLANEVGKGGDDVPKIHPTDYPNNEVGTLATSLARSFERIRSFVEREKAFTHDASHELRTPLAIVQSGTELVLGHAQLQPEPKAAAQRVLAASQDMEQMLEILLRLAREKDHGPEQASFKLLPLVEKAVLAADVRFPNSSIDMRIDIDPRFEVWSNQTLLQSILHNLVGNAFQHVRTGKVTIKAKDRSLIIHDQGRGIGAQNFIPFEKGKGSDGFGLGLAIVNRLCAQLKIDLAIRSIEGAGSAVKLNFPPPEDM